MVRNILKSAAAFWLLIGVGSPVSAARVTQGDAEAVFNAGFNGGWAIVLNNDGSLGAPADFRSSDLVRIATEASFNGKHYCSLDWHAVGIAINEGRRPGEEISNQVIFDRLAARDPTFKLDSVLLETERTPPKRMLNPETRGFVEAFTVMEGRVMAPQDIAVGQHTLQGFNSAGASIGLVTFHIDAPGTGVCGVEDALTFRELS